MNITKRRQKIILGILLTLLVIVGYFAFKGWRLYRIGQSLKATQTEFETLSVNGLSNADPAATAQLVRDVRVDFVDLQREVKPLLWLTPYLGWMPRVGALMPEAREYLMLADAGTDAGDQLAPTIEAGLTALQVGGNPINAAVTTLADAAPTMQAIEPNITTIQSVWDGLQTKEALPWAVRQRIPQIDALLPFADEGVEVAQILPDLVGGEKQYLLLIQNDDELRATGGFISGVGQMRIINGDIASLDFHTSDYDYTWLVENSERLDWPPEPLTRYMNLQYLLYRDANYWPDFPTSAEKILELYTLEYPDSPTFDGVIAIDQQFVSVLLSGTGAVFVPELDQMVNSDNVIDVMRSAWNPPEEVVTGEWFEDRKSFVGDVAKAIQERVLTDPTQLDLMAMSNALIEAVETRHLQIYVPDAAVAAQLAEIGWDGGVELPASGDFLLIVDSNMGYNKAHGAVERSIDYRVDLGTQSAELNLRYRHPATERSEPCEPYTRYSGELQYQDMLDACLYNFVRVYPAAGSQLLSGSSHPISGALTITGESFDGAPLVGEESSSYFGNFFIVTPATSLLNSYRYSLPANVVQDNVYRLQIQKQAGADTEQLHVEVIAPTGTTIQSTTPSATINGNTAVFDLAFDRDTTLEVVFAP